MLGAERVSAMNLADVVRRLTALGALDAGRMEILTKPGGRPVTYRALLALTRLRPGECADIIASVHGLPRAELSRLRAEKSLADLFSPQFLRETGLFPYRAADGAAWLATADPLAVDAIDAIAVTIGETMTLTVATFEDIEIALDVGLPTADSELAQKKDLADIKPDDPDSLRDLASGAPVVRALDDIFERAVALRATDIHIEPLRRDLQLRVRVDGVMRTLPVPKAISPRALVSRIKILAGLNIAEHRLPQDGRLQTEIGGRAIDVRVATMPTTAGEAAILRLLDRGKVLMSLENLGFRPRDFALLRNRLAQPHGLFVVTGPTGSGKTTTLAAAIARLNDQTRKILTIEDPVEYEMAGVAQSQVRPAVGLTFATALRAFLRQDPDVIMVGEIRDAETGRIAVQAALTGHLVLTTLHTNTAAAAVTRLADIGIERYLIASTLIAVVGQRLLRMLCEDCRKPFTVTDDRLAGDPRLAGLRMPLGATLHEPVGCERCGHTGYRGRRAIFECFDVNERARRAILAGADEAAIEAIAAEDGMATLLEDGRARCLESVTSLDEVFRVSALR